MGIVVRLFQFMNSFYRDKVEGDFGISGDYCCLGYFDALKVNLIGTFENEVAGNMRERVYEQIISTIDGKCSQKNIICVTEDEQKDAVFWGKKDRMPYLFITMMHVQHNENDSTDQVEAFEEHENKKEDSLVERVNKREDSIAYYTYDHCEVVIAHFDKSYDAGVQFIFQYLEDKDVYKLYSTFCILQTLVEKKSELVKVADKENVNCLLRASLKDLGKSKIFLKKLERKFSKQDEKNKAGAEPYQVLGNKEKDRVEAHKVLGSKDIVIELRDVPLEELIECYSLNSKDECGNLLNHNNRFYKSSFFNIETEILKARKRGEPNGCANT